VTSARGATVVLRAAGMLDVDAGEITGPAVLTVTDGVITAVGGSCCPA
jgi:adhesin HecA-like repeat protein